MTQIAIDCPRLAPEPRAALEARAQTDLLARGESGSLTISCVGEAVRLAFRPDRGAPSEAVAPLSPDPRQSVDAALEALDALLNGVDSPPMAGAGIGDGPPPLLPPVRAAIPPSPSSEAPSNATTVPAVPATVGAAAAVGAAFDVWSAAVVGTLGPSARAHLLLPPRVSLDAGAGVAWALGSPLGVDARVVTAFAGIDGALDEARHFRAGVEGIACFLHVDASPASGPTSASHTGVAGRLRASYALPLSAGTAIVIGPTVTLRPTELRVRLGSREAFRVPSVTVGTTVELRFGAL